MSALLHEFLHLPAFSDEFRAALGPILSRLLALIENFYDTLEQSAVVGIETIIGKVIRIASCATPLFLASWDIRMVIGFIDKYLGGGISELAIPFEYGSRL